jgi:hypothetical protein
MLTVHHGTLMNQVGVDSLIVELALIKIRNTNYNNIFLGITLLSMHVKDVTVVIYSS